MNSAAIYAISYRRSEMRQLVIQALAYRENRSIREIEKQLRSRQFSVPAEVSYILGLEDRPVEARKSIDLIDFIKQRLEWIAERFVAPRFSPDPRIEKVAEYVENLMEVDNDARYH